MKFLNINANKGMFLETFINHTIQFYVQNHLCWIRKQNLFVAPVKVVNQEIKGKLNYKNDVDYYGIYKGVFVCFEAKQTLKDRFLLSNLKPHQWEFLAEIDAYQGIAFLILSFLNTNEIFAIPYQSLARLRNQQIKSITYPLLKEIGFLLEIKLPGIIDILSFLEFQLNQKKIP